MKKKLSYSGGQFSESLRKRVKLVRRIYLAALRERIRKQQNSSGKNKNNAENIVKRSSDWSVNRSSAMPISNQSNQTPGIIRITIRMFIATIAAVLLHSLFSTIIQAFKLIFFSFFLIWEKFKSGPGIKYNKASR